MTARWAALLPACLSHDGCSLVLLWHLSRYCGCVAYDSSPAWRPWPSAASGFAAFAARSCFLIPRLLSESIFSGSRGLTRQDVLIAEWGGRGRRSTSMYGTCQLKLFFAFHLVGFLSIQLFICISAGGCANSCHESLCVFVWKKCQSTETQTACSVKSCGRNAQTPIRGGLCRRTQTEMKAKNGCAAFQLPGFVTVWVLALKGRNWVINCPVGNLLKKKKKRLQGTWRERQ